MKKRDLFAELMQGVGEMAAQREGKITLRKSSQMPKRLY
jgi:putative transcriptional regulator